MKANIHTIDRSRQAPTVRTVWLLFAVIFVTVYFASLFSPPLLDDVDAAHAQAAQHMALSGDLITSKINGIRYIEKPPLPYWLVAGMYRIFGQNTFATHLPNALAMLGLTWLAWLWARRAWGDRAGFYAGLGVLTSVGCFLFTRFIIPEAILAFFLLLALYALIASLEDDRPCAHLLGLCRRGAGAADQGPDCAGFLSGRGHSLSAAHRAMAALEGSEAGVGIAGVSGHRRALAHSVRHHQSRPGTPGGQSPHHRKRARVLLLLLHQRARAALLQPALSARLQQDAGRVVLAGASGVDLPVEPVFARRGGGGMEDAAQLAQAPAPRCRRHGGLLPGQRHARRRGQLCAAREVPRAHHLAAEPVYGMDIAVLFASRPTRSTTHFRCGRRW